MRPKKKDQIIEEDPKPQFEQMQADHELFLQAFESKPRLYVSRSSRTLLNIL